MNVSSEFKRHNPELAKKFEGMTPEEIEAALADVNPDEMGFDGMEGLGCD